MVVCKPRYRDIVKDLALQSGQYIIRQSEKIKILGIYYTNSLDNTPNVNMIIQKVNYRVKILSQVIKYTNIKTALILYNSLIISVYNYSLENLINISARQLNNLNVLLNKCTHNILGFRSYKLNTYNFFREINWISLPQMVIFLALKLLHKIS